MSFPRYPAYKPSCVEWLGEVPEHWDILPLKRRSRLLTEKTECRDNPVALENIEGWTGRFVETDTEFQGEGIAFESGDILFGKLRPYLAKVYLAAISGQAVGDFHVIHPLGGLNSRFLQLALLTRELIDLVNGSTFGAKMPRASWDFLGSLPLCMPPLDEQHAIASFLDRETAKIDALIAEQQRLMELLQEKRQAVISHAVTKGLNPNAPMKDSGVEWLGEVPEHWEVKNIGLVTERITYGFTNPMPTEDEGPYMLTANDIENGRIRFETCRRTSKSAFMEELTDKSRPVSGDILLTKDGTLGRVALYIEKDEAACINQSVALLRPNTTACLGAFLAIALSSDCYQEKMLFDAGGTTIKHIYISRLAKMPVAIPPTGEQEEMLQNLESRTRPYELLVADSAASLMLLRERRSALISAAVTGQIDVRGLVEAEGS
jgi:type I restriction enzyme S subunit